MRTPGTYIERQPVSLKDAETALVTECGGQDRAAALTRVRPSQMQRYTSPGEPRCHMPIDVVQALEMHCGVPHVTRFLAYQSSAVLIQFTKGDSAHVSAHLSAIGRETGEMFGKACDGLHDNCLSPKEAAAVKAEAFKTITALSALIGDLLSVGKETA
jgi:hypothetical protein